jgi:hypothetical protein
MSGKNGNMGSDERFNRIEAMLAEIVEIQRETNSSLRQQARVMKMQAQAIVEREERMDRIERHLEVLINITDGLIREGGKKRRERGPSLAA